MSWISGHVFARFRRAHSIRGSQANRGVLLLNLAPGLTFNQSLAKMMKPNQVFSGGGTRWCKKFDIAVRAVPEIERKLFQMNIHEQSLFPDMQGLAGLIKQRLRLHWNRPRNSRS